MAIQIVEYQTTHQLGVEKLLADLQSQAARLDPAQDLLSTQDFKADKYLQYILDELKPPSKIFVALDDQQVIGFVVAAISKFSSETNFKMKPSTNPTGSIDQIIVDEAYRGRGLGQQLFKQAEQFFKSQSCTLIELDCLSSNTHTLDFYRKHGFIDRAIYLVKVLK